MKMQRTFGLMIAGLLMLAGGSARQVAAEGVRGASGWGMSRDGAALLEKPTQPSVAGFGKGGLEKDDDEGDGDDDRKGRIEGTVRSTSRQTLSGVSVDVQDASGSTGKTALTNSSGHYKVKKVTPGTYTVVFRLNGYVTKTDPGIGVLAGRTRRLDEKLASVPTTSVTVNVVLSTTGAAIAGAIVTITYSNGSPSASGTTNSSGSVIFTGQPVGAPATVTATTSSGASGSVPIAFGFGGGANVVTVNI